MGRTRWMHKLLGEMIQYAEKRNRREVSYRMKVYIDLALRDNPPFALTETGMVYDNIAQAVLFSVKQKDAKVRRDYLEGARETYLKTPKPRL